MRITENINYNAVRNHIGKAREKMDRLSNQAITLKKILTPSDDPVETTKIMESKTEIMNNHQYHYTALLAKNQLEAADSALNDLSDILIRTKELALTMASDPNASEPSRRATAAEVQSLFDSALVIANRKFSDRYLFSGYQIKTAPIKEDGSYAGDDGIIRLEIEPNAFLTVNLTADEIFNAKEEQSNVRINCFSALDDLKNALMTDDKETIRLSLDQFDTLYSHLISLRAKLGSRLTHLDQNIRGLDKQTESTIKLLAQIEDADLSEVVTNLTRQETVYKNALASSKRLVQPTLLDFIK
jgi:flagellar hook-associated protein 3 FlgL